MNKNDVDRTQTELEGKGVFGDLEKKPNNTIASDFNRRTNQDGSYRKYKIDGPVNEDGLFQEVSRILGLDSHEKAELENDLAKITEMVASWTQTDSYEINGAFIKQLLRRMQTGNTNRAKLHNLKRKLEELWGKERKE